MLPGKNVQDRRARPCGHDVVRFELPAIRCKFACQPCHRVQRVAHDGGRIPGKDGLLEQEGGDVDVRKFANR